MSTVFLFFSGFGQKKNLFPPGSLTLAHSRNSQMSFMYGFFFVGSLTVSRPTYNTQSAQNTYAV